MLNFENPTSYSWSATPVYQIWCKSIDFWKIRLPYWIFDRHIGSVIKDFVNLPHQILRGVHQLQFEPKNDMIACELLFLQAFSSGHSIFLRLPADILEPPNWIFQRRTRHSKVDALSFKISPWSIFLVASNFGRSSDPVDADCPIYKKIFSRFFARPSAGSRLRPSWPI